MKLSVVMSSYNGEQYIEEQLESIQQQEQRPNEVLIRDDGSTDQTVAIVRQFIKKHHLENWQIKVNQKNIGWRANFMEGMHEAQGDLIFLSDQDDIWLPNKLKVMEKIMLANPQVNVLASNYQKFTENGLGSVVPYSAGHKLKKINLYNNYMDVKAPGCTYCVRKDFVNPISKVWDKNYPHDELAWCLALFTDSLYLYTEPLIKWRQHSTSAFAKESRSLKSKAKKYDWIKSSVMFNNSVNDFLTIFPNTSSLEKKQKLIKATDHYLHLREKFYDSKNIIYGVQLLKYWNLYPRYRQYLLDWYLVFFNHK